MNVLIYATFALVCVCVSALAWNGFFGFTVWRWVRYPFAIIGSIFMAIAMNGVTMPSVPVKEENEEEIEQPREIETPAEPGNPENRFGRQLFALRGLTPLDVKRNVLSQAQSAHTPDPDFDEIEWLQEKEPIENFRLRKKLERAS